MGKRGVQLMRRYTLFASPVILLFFLVSGCSGPKPANQSPASGSAGTTSVSMNKDDYPVFPDADAGADPTVPAEQGGKGFKGEGWETNTTFDLIVRRYSCPKGWLRPACGFT
jgi:hypothetical protein